MTRLEFDAMWRSRVITGDNDQPESAKESVWSFVKPFAVRKRHDSQETMAACRSVFGTIAKGETITWGGGDMSYLPTTPAGIGDRALRNLFSAKRALEFICQHPEGVTAKQIQEAGLATLALSRLQRLGVIQRSQVREPERGRRAYHWVWTAVKVTKQQGG